MALRNEIDDVKCPYCKSENVDPIEGEDVRYISEMDDQDKATCECYDCGKIFEVEAEIEIIREAYYYITEIPQPDDYIKDIEGQQYLWENLNLGGIDLSKFPLNKLA